MLIDKSNDKTRALFALSTAAMSLGLGPKNAFAAMEEGSTVSVQLSNYGEDDIPSSDLGLGDAGRYDITTGQFRVRSAIGDDTEIVFTAAAESMSGASPWYVQPAASDDTVVPVEGEPAADDSVNVVQVMSGATIDEERTEGNLTLRKYWGHSNFGLHFGYSNENDYTSNSFGLSTAISLFDQATTVELALSASQDYVEPTDSFIRGRVEKEDKNAKNASLGITQIIDKNFLVSSTVSFSRYKGFLSDAYKRAWIVDTLPPTADGVDENPGDQNLAIEDSRPSSKNQFAWTASARYFVEPLNAAIHADYRYYTNDWGIVSNTIEFGWHQNFFENMLLLAPQVRFYAQSEAEFYELFYEVPRVDGFYSSDYRLSDYTAVSAALQGTLRFEKYNINANVERYISSGDNPGLVDFTFVSVGFDLKF